MSGDGALVEALRELAGDAFGHAASVDEHQRRAVLLDELRQASIDLRPRFARHDRLQGRTGQFQLKVARALMPGVDGRDVRGRTAGRIGADQEMRDRVDWVLRGGQADALQAIAAQRREPFQREREMRAALIRRDRVDFVDDDGPRGRQHCASGLRTQENVERFRGRNEDVRRIAAHPRAFGRRRVARSDPSPDFDLGKTAPAELFPDAGQRGLEVAMDVVRQRLKRGNVNDVRCVGQPPFETLPHQFVDRRQEGRERLARAGWRRDEGVAASLDCRPGFGLSRSRRGEAQGEPARDRRVEQLKEALRRSRRKARRSRARPGGRAEADPEYRHAVWLPAGEGCQYMAPDPALVTLSS